MEDKRIVEINGIKIEVDMRTAKRVDQFRVGDPCKVLIKSYSGYASHFGMIIGFDEFKMLPTMIVAYLQAGSYESPIKICYLNAESKDIEICPHDPKDIGIEKEDILESFARQIEKKHLEIKDLEHKKKYFTEQFGKYFQ